MRIPNEVKIGGHIVKVERVPPEKMAGDCLGWFSHEPLQILIKEGKESLEAETFLHEMIEFIAGMHELGLEHHQVQSLAHSLFQVLHDNDLRFGKTG